MADQDIEVMRAGEGISVTTKSLKVMDIVYPIAELNNFKIEEGKTANPMRKNIFMLAFFIGSIGFLISGIFGALVGVLIFFFAATAPQYRPIYLLTCLQNEETKQLYKHLDLNEIEKLKAGIEYAKAATLNPNI